MSVYLDRKDVCKACGFMYNVGEGICKFSVSICRRRGLIVPFGQLWHGTSVEAES